MLHIANVKQTHDTIGREKQGGGRELRHETHFQFLKVSVNVTV